MHIRIRETERVVSEFDFRKLHENISPIEELTESRINELGADVVYEGQQPTGATVYQYSQSIGVELISGKWYTKFVLGPIHADTIDNDGKVTTAAHNEVIYKSVKDSEQAQKIRAIRDEKLAESDWTQIPDCTIPKKSDWAIYRKALRDIPSQTGFPWDVTYPVKP
jgi:hypothetical protein